MKKDKKQKKVKTPKAPKQKGALRFITQYLGKYKKYAIITPILVMIEAIIEVLIPLCMTKLISLGIGSYDGATFIPGEFKYVLIWGGVMIGLALISLVTGSLAARTAVLASHGLAKNIRQAEFEAIQKFSFSNADKFQTSSLITRLTTDVNNMQAAYQMTIRLIIRAPIMLVFATTMSFMINKELAMMYIYVIPILVIGLSFIIYFAYPHFKVMLGKIDNMNRSVQENLVGIRVVKSFVREDYEKEKFHQASNDVRNTQLKAEKIVVLNSPLINFCMYGSLVTIAFVGGVNIINGVGGMQYADLSAFVSYTVQILMSLMMISMFLVNQVMAQASMNRIVEVLKEVPAINDFNVKEDIPLNDGSIEFKDVNFSYNNDLENCVLDNINLKIKSGETIGIIGGTGSSKSTIVSLIPRLYETTSGEVIVGGHNVKDYKIKTLRDDVSMVLQKNVLFSGSIKDNLRWGNENATDEEIVEACKKACADDFIQNFPEGYDKDLGQGGVNVSGGQKQRLCIARALLKKPKIIILDDSTSAVDTATDSKIREEFRKNLSDVTTIIIAQRVSSIKDADRILVLDDGKISGFAPHDELMKTNAIYQEVYSSQMKGVDENEK